MSIADKLTEISANNSIIAENIPKVYEAGKQAGGGGEDCLQYATKVQFGDWNLFGKANVEVNIPTTITNYMQIFQEMTTVNTTVEHLTVNSNAKITSANMAFAKSGGNDTTLKYLTLNCDFSNCTDIAYIFWNLQALEEIITPDDKPLDLTKCTSAYGIASGCTNLKEIRLAPSSINTSIEFPDCSKLSYATVESLINGLATVSKTKTLTLNSAQKILQSQKEVANARGWTISGGTIVSEVW